MQLKPLVLLSTFLIPVLAIGRECCCDRYSQFDIDNKDDVVAHCKNLWADVAAGRSSEDYCESGYCIQQQSWVDVPNLGKCVVAGYQCGKYLRNTIRVWRFGYEHADPIIGDCAIGNVGCLG